TRYKSTRLNSWCDDKVVRDFAAILIGNMIGVDEELRVLKHRPPLLENNLWGICPIVQSASAFERRAWSAPLFPVGGRNRFVTLTHLGLQYPPIQDGYGTARVSNSALSLKRSGCV